MRCPTCKGERYIMRRRDGYPLPGETIGVPVPCPDCLGGEVHCCDGETACNAAPVPRGTG